MTTDQLAQIAMARPWLRLMSPRCRADAGSIPCESAFAPLAFPLEAGSLRLDV
jgi:hypothetical protein